MSHSSSSGATRAHAARQQIAQVRHGRRHADQNISLFLSAPSKHGLHDDSDSLTAGEHMRGRKHGAGTVPPPPLWRGAGLTVAVSSEATRPARLSGFPHASWSDRACRATLAGAACISSHETGKKRGAWGILVAWNSWLKGATINERKPGPVHSPLWLHTTLPVANPKKKKKKSSYGANR